MSNVLFSINSDVSKSSTVKHKPTELPRQLFHIIRGATDAFEALSLFLQLSIEPFVHQDQELCSNLGYQSFDAHVGDTACQLRACMLMDLSMHLKKTVASSTIGTITSIIADLEELLQGSRRLMTALLELDWTKIRAGALDQLGIPKDGLTTEELLVKLGWPKQSAFMYYDHSDSFQALFTSRAALPSTTSSSSDLSETDTTPASSICESETPPLVDSLRHCWDLSDSGMVVKFLVSSYVLSKYKQLTTVNGVYQASLKPELAFQFSQSLVAQEFGRQFVRPNKRTNREELLSLQRYVSDLSCAWIDARSRESLVLHPNHRALFRSTLRMSAKGVESASSYVTYLVLRGLWVMESTPMIIMTTRFCPLGMSRPNIVRYLLTICTGFHRNYFRVYMQISCKDDEDSSKPPVHSSISWSLTRLSGTELHQLRQCLDPYIMVSGNSIDGNATDYVRRLPTAHTHIDETCSDNEDHCSAMLKSDQDQVVQAIFAEHRHYAFALSGSEAILGEDLVVQCLMDKCVPGLSAAWQKSRGEAAQLGTGSSYDLYMWQHVVLETPAHFLARVEGSDRPAISNFAL